MRYSVPEWKAKSVLVTGASGMLGHAVTRLLRDNDANVYALVRDADSCPESCTALECDITDLESVTGLLQSSDFDFILHLAAQSQVDGFSPKTTFESNVAGTFNLLEAARLAGQSAGQSATLILASTDGASRFWHEFESPTNRRVDLGPYPASKMCAEILAHCYSSAYGLSAGVIRLTNLYGPHDRNVRRLVPGTICAVLKGQPPTFRSDPQTPVNFLYVDDAATALLGFAMQVADGSTDLRLVTARSPAPMTIDEMVTAILGAMQRPDLGNTREPPGTAVSEDRHVSSAGEDWGWQPQVSLEVGLDETIRWYRQNFNE